MLATYLGTMSLTTRAGDAGDNSLLDDTDGQAPTAQQKRSAPSTSEGSPFKKKCKTYTGPKTPLIAADIAKAVERQRKNIAAHLLTQHTNLCRRLTISCPAVDFRPQNLIYKRIFEKLILLGQLIRDTKKGSDAYNQELDSIKKWPSHQVQDYLMEINAFFERHDMDSSVPADAEFNEEGDAFTGEVRQSEASSEDEDDTFPSKPSHARMSRLLEDSRTRLLAQVKAVQKISKSLEDLAQELERESRRL